MIPSDPSTSAFTQHSAIRVWQLALVLVGYHSVAATDPGAWQATDGPPQSGLSREAATETRQRLWQDWQARIRADHELEWNTKKITLDQLEMKFETRTFGQPAATGRRLFISMHGGGGAPARINEQQWRNQIGLYEPEEGLYLAPRAPTDHWNLWHEPHIDRFFQRIIGDAVVFEQVDANRVYLLGYSAGGDGVYQLAPRMADRWAAAAMMAGHPNDASPLGLRNIGFTLHMGGDDGAYGRNEVAARWKTRLAELQAADPDGYQHSVTLHKGLGHWMEHRDDVALPWMAAFRRDPRPRRVVWHQSPVTHGQFYWLAVDPENEIAGSTVIVARQGQTISIEQADKIRRLTVLLDDDLVDLDRPVTVCQGDQVLFQGMIPRSAAMLQETLEQRGDRYYMFPASVTVDLENADD